MNIRALLLLIGAAGTAAGCTSKPTAGVAADKQAVRGLMERINAAWEAEDLATFSGLVAHDASLIAFGSDSGERWVGWDNLAKGLQAQFEVFSHTKVTPHTIDVHVSETGTAAWLAQEMRIDTRLLGNPLSLEARITNVWEKRSGEWKLVQFHYSLPISESKKLVE